MIEHPGNRIARSVGQRAKRRSGFVVVHSLNGVVQALLHGHGLKVASRPQDNEPISARKQAPWRASGERGTIFGTSEKEIAVAITASKARRELFPLIEKVNADRAPVEITSKRGNAVLMSADDYAAWKETAYLFRSPANARRLLDAADAAQRGEMVGHPLDRE
jgi:antitoxin YefM